MSDDWTELYRPKLLADVVGNPKAIEDLRAWADSWESNRPTKKAAVLIGPPGTGKTSTALALASEYKWDAVEMNASDQRNADSIKAVAVRGAMGETFTESGEYLSVKQGHRKLIILDEADNISGQEDKGGIPAIAELVRSTKQPIILIVNDFYALTKKSSVLKSQTEQVKFSKIKTVTVRGILRKIAKDQGTNISDKALEVLAENSGGDLRSAVRDLQAVSLGSIEVTAENAGVVGAREVEKTMYNAMEDVFQGTDPRRARHVLSQVDESPDVSLLWIEENLPAAYRDHLDLYNGYYMLSRASTFLGRVQRRQYYRFWAYASDFLSFGVCAIKKTRVQGYVRYGFPSYLMKMSRTKGTRALQNGISLKLGALTHMSSRSVRQDVLPYFRWLYTNDQELRIKMTIDLELEDEEIAFLLGEKVDTKAVKKIIEEAKAVASSGFVKQVSKPKVEDDPPPAEGPAKPVQSAPGTQKSLFQF